MITQFTCTCGNTDPQKAQHYDGAVGYEALICTVCGRYYDHVGTGEHEADEWSQQFVTGETQAINEKRKQKLIAFYLDWKNNFLTLHKMAEHYRMPVTEVETLIDLGRHYHEEAHRESRKALKN
jgi:hypothetical protein